MKELTEEESALTLELIQAKHSITQSGTASYDQQIIP